MRNILFAAAIGMSSTLFAIGGIQGQQAQSPSHGMTAMTAMECPMKVADVDLSIEDTIDGIRLTFTAKSSNVAELRRRVEAMARMHGAPGAPATAGIHENMMPIFATYEAVPDGARITLMPQDPQKLDEFRRKVREHAAQMKKGECAMMGSMMRGSMEGMKSPPAPTSPEPKAQPELPDHGAHHPPAEKKQ